MGKELGHATESGDRAAFLIVAAKAYEAARTLNPDPDSALWETTLADGLTD